MSRRSGAKGHRDRTGSVFQLPDHGSRKRLRGRTAAFATCSPSFHQDQTKGRAWGPDGMNDEPFEIDRLIGKQIRYLRCQQGRSLAAIADKIGVSYQQLQKYETGSNRISVVRLWQIATTLNIEPNQILAALPSVGQSAGWANGRSSDNLISSVESLRFSNAYSALPAETRRVVLHLMEAVAGEAKPASGRYGTASD